MSEKSALLDALRDQIARTLHDWDHGKQENDSPTEPCWHAYRVEADLLMPQIRPHLATAWIRGWEDCEKANCDNCYSCGGWIGFTPNPYLDHGAACTCEFCRTAAMGGGR